MRFVSVGAWRPSASQVALSQILRLVKSYGLETIRCHLDVVDDPGNGSVAMVRVLEFGMRWGACFPVVAEPEPTPRSPLSTTGGLLQRCTREGVVASDTWGERRSELV